jgi:uncharacterized repeat protein (TIGR03803 family)
MSFGLFFLGAFMRRAFLFGFGLLAFAVFGAPASFGRNRESSETVLYSFCDQNDCTDGKEPLSTVTLDGQGNVFGATVIGGGLSDECDYGCGTIYEIRQRNGFPAYHHVYTFCSQKNCSDGAGPIGALVRDVAGNFYGATGGKGKHGFGTVFMITPRGKLTVLHSFCAKSSCSDGGNPSSTSAVLTYAGASSGQSYDGVSPLYGTTLSGGNSNSGTIFKLEPTDKKKWKYSVLYKFCSLANCADGANPDGVIADDNGVLYGQTNNFNLPGTVFKFGGSTFSVLYTFCRQLHCTDGSSPRGAPVVDKNGNVFGITQTGGSANLGVLYEVTAGGNYSILHNFCSETDCTDGHTPVASPFLDKSGNLYGTTVGGGALGQRNGGGTVYRYKGSTYQVLYNFCPDHPTCSDGVSPNTPVVVDSTGNIFGTTIGGGTTFGNNGTVFEVFH